MIQRHAHESERCEIILCGREKQTWVNRRVVVVRVPLQKGYHILGSRVLGNVDEGIVPPEEYNFERNFGFHLWFELYAE